MALESGTTAMILPAGAPCWVELSTGNEPRAREFYAALLDWRYQVTPDSTVMTGRYVIATRDGYPVAGVFQTDRPIGWVPHMTVANTTTEAEKVRSFGGNVTLGPIDLPRYDSIVYAVDPLGAPVVLRCPPAGWLFTAGTAGTFASADLNTRDGTTADEFYCRMFGYTAVQIGDALNYDYAEWQLGGQPVLYRYVMGPEYPANTPAHWMIYFVADPIIGTDTTAMRALELGGTVVVQPYDTRLGRVAVLADPGGAQFAVIDFTDSLEKRRPAVEDPDDE
ncbi:VOC family protein [Actinophytocola sp.]|uniref:VOC family protein n=1 Tax=Actinophytocola sp. TaxID=1872138 RepID=UPI002ED66901